MPYTKLALARFCVLAAMRLLPPDSWAFERLGWVNDSLKMQMGRHRAPGES
ncbi:hypothetical protein FHS67_002108 [Aminobacter aminovorans]|uniref:Uncharacterized protein n=1 Tax=Aminobacter aminovorans TaxID=83263 RepID=A0AAC8YN53_AMIAI|nr:hypothetical protein [Aminobacter aminovorans]AMS41228.1 hypothetical protein AA2016_2300 [Aminobacter aminovorans]MBB3705789.1 hypothetical protein [Aminobacter aminovorans]